MCHIYKIATIQKKYVKVKLLDCPLRFSRTNISNLIVHSPRTSMAKKDDSYTD
jgi:hypothetical protein